MLMRLALAALAVVGSLTLVRADGLAPAGTAAQGLCYASGTSGARVPCVLQGGTWTGVLRPTDPADALTLAGRLLPTIVSAAIYQMPGPSGNAATDAVNFATAQASGAQTIVLQTGVYLVPPAGYAQLLSNQSVVGQGSGRTTLRLTGQGTYSNGAIYALERSNIVLTGFTLDYAGYSAPPLFNGTNPGTLTIRNGVNVTLNDVNVIGFPLFGFIANGGNNVSYRRGQITRATTPLDSAGAAIPLGRQNQCVLVSASAGTATNFLFEDVTCSGSAFDTWGSNFLYIRTNVVGFDFGFAYVTEARPGSDRHYFLNARASGGRTNPATGMDDNATVAGCFEIWSTNSVIDNAVCDNVGGDGVSLGGPNSRVTNSRFTRLGMQVASNGIVSRYESGGYTATGSLISNNTVVNSNASGDGSNLTFPYTQQSGPANLVVTLTGNDFGTTPLNRKGLGELWSAPGMLVTATTSSGYTHPSGTRQSPAANTVPGAVRSRDAILSATFRAADGTALPAGLRLSAAVDSDNSVRFYVEDISGGSTSITVPAGTYSARLITIN